MQFPLPLTSMTSPFCDPVVPEQLAGWPAHYDMRADGLYVSEGDTTRWIAQRFSVLGQCADEQGRTQGLVLEFADSQQRHQRLVVAHADLFGAGFKVARQLLDQGFVLNPDRQSWPLLQLLLRALRPARACLLVDQTGWQHGAFVLPDQVIGTPSRPLIYHGLREPQGLGAAAELADWQTQVSALCQGNSRLVFSLSLAFAAPLLALAQAQTDSTVFNLVGPSSTGKTTVLHAAASVSGPGTHLQSWQVSGPGLEAAALAHNHRLLILDEFAQIPASQAKALIYHLTNGRGALRGRSDGSLRPLRHWQTLVLSAGEAGLALHSGQQAALAAGQLVRVIDLPAEVPGGDGVFEDLHGFSDGGALARALAHASRHFYGTAFPAYLERLCCSDQAALAEELASGEGDFFTQSLPAGAKAQLQRVARRFFLVGFAGELASRLDISGWPPGEALQAAHTLFAAWLQSVQGLHSLDAHLVLEQVRDFLHREQARLLELPQNPYQRAEIREPARCIGYVRHRDGHGHHFIKARVFTKEVLRGLDVSTAIRILTEAGILQGNPHTNQPYQNQRLPLGNSASQRVYHLCDVFSSPCEVISEQAPGALLG